MNASAPGIQNGVVDVGGGDVQSASSCRHSLVQPAPTPPSKDAVPTALLRCRLRSEVQALPYAWKSLSQRVLLLLLPILHCQPIPLL